MRILNKLLAAVVSLGLIAGGLLVAIEVIFAELGRSSWVIPYEDWYRAGQSHAWSSPIVRNVGIALCAIGVVLLLLQLVKHAPEVVSLEDQKGQHGQAVVRRRSLERCLERAAHTVDGISRARVRVRRNSVRVRARTNRRNPGDLKAHATVAVSERIGTTNLARAPRIAVALRHREER